MNNLLYDEIPYKDIVANWEHRYEWSEWDTCRYIAGCISGTKVRCTIEERIWRFTSNWQIECAVAEALGIDFYDDTHECFHTGPGLFAPDFIDKEGKTYELKTVRLAYDDTNWWGADHHLYFNRAKGILYEQFPDGSYVAITNINVKTIGV